jgi:excisionase family DNA binding protein
MSNWLSISEAAAYLGVSKATLRNWDREGKLKAKRHPLNKYRGYELGKLKNLKAQLNLFPDNELEPLDAAEHNVLQLVQEDTRQVKRTLAKLHAAIRDIDGSSSLLERFDEISKLLYLWLLEAGSSENIFSRKSEEGDGAYVERIQNEYSKAAKGIKASHKNYDQLLLSGEAVLEVGRILSGPRPKSSSFDIKGLAYEEIIKGTFDKSDNQQFFTPKQIVSFMVSSMANFLNGKVGDPACGTGGFLSEVIRQSPGRERCHVVGAEIDSRLAWISALNMKMHGAKKFDIHYLPGGGSLVASAHLRPNSIDAIITNPPFGSDVSAPEVLSRYKLGSGRTSRRRGILFIEACHNLLKDGGVLSVIIDEGVLNLPSARDVREFILSHFEVMGVVSLPEVAFMPYANVATSIMFLKKKKDPKQGQVFFAKAEQVGRKPNGDDDVLYSCNGPSKENSDLPDILAQWLRHLSGETVTNIANCFQAEVVLDGENVDLRIDCKYHHPSRALSSRLLRENRSRLMSLESLCDERNDSVLLPVEFADQNVLYTGLANIEVNNGFMTQELTPSAALKSAVKRYEPGDILFSRMRPNLKKIAFVGAEEGGFTSAECYVLKVKRKTNGDFLIDPVMLAALLRSDFVHGQIMHLVAGIGRPRLNITDMRNIQIPVPSPASQKRAMDHYIGRIAVAQDMKSKAALLLSESKKAEASAVEALANELLKE